MSKNKLWQWAAIPAAVITLAPKAFGGEADINIPDLGGVKFAGLGGVSGATLMYVGIFICLVGAVFGLVQYAQTKALPVHQSMANVSQTIWETCKTYLFTQGKFLAILWVLIAGCMFYYFYFLQNKAITDVALILLCSILGILGSYGVAWFGIRINTVANSRMPLSPPCAAMRWPLWASRCVSGMSVRPALWSPVELFFMISIPDVPQET